VYDVTRLWRRCRHIGRGIAYRDASAARQNWRALREVNRRHRDEEEIGKSTSQRLASTRDALLRASGGEQRSVALALSFSARVRQRLFLPYNHHQQLSRWRFIAFACAYGVAASANAPAAARDRRCRGGIL